MGHPPSTKEEKMKTIFAFVGLLSLSASCQSPVTPVAKHKTVIELFTSEGCSSCPSAEKYAEELAKDTNNIIVSYHVDYWNRLGWVDAFSSKEFSQKQYYDKEGRLVNNRKQRQLQKLNGEIFKRINDRVSYTVSSTYR